jgi:hypothetical protein
MQFVCTMTHTYVLTSSHNLSLSLLCVNVGVRMTEWMGERMSVWMYVDCFNVSVQVMFVFSNMMNVRPTVFLLR